jgi:uncharacterized protein
MKETIKNKLILIAKSKQIKSDPSHDFQHIVRVTNLAIKISEKVGADLDIIIPAALFHDTIVYRKDSPKCKNETEESAEIAGDILKKITGYPSDKINKVKICIKQCSFTKGIIPDILESKVLQDADMLESTGAVSIMRTFSSGGQMNRPFYDPKDPFCRNGINGAHSGVWLFYKRLLLIENRIHTEYARKIAKRRTVFLRSFLSEFKRELMEANIL